jgi:1-pyrroline-5-carboxylate dehydrogenase
MGPVIDEEAMNKILGYIAYGRQHYPTLHGGAPIESDTNGYFIAPTIFGDVPSTDKLGQEEIFGPVLAMIPAKNYQQALTYANSTEYGLTGAVYSRSRERLEQARREFHVGNLYLNRKCTGAIVGVHPFGGFNMSGTDSKAGGPDYLLLFTQAKSIAEKL